MLSIFLLSEKMEEQLMMFLACEDQAAWAAALMQTEKAKHPN